MNKGLLGGITVCVLFWALVFLCVHLAFAQTVAPAPGTYGPGVSTTTTVNGTACALGGSCSPSGSTFANPSAVASDTANNGSATTAMRSDASPAVQKASNAQFGLAKGDGVTIDCGTVAGTCASAAGVTNATTSTAGTGASPTIAQFDAGWYKNLLAGSLTATIPVSTSLSIYGGVFVAGINAGTIAATSPDTITSAAGTTGPGGNIAVDAGCNATVTTNGAGNLYVAGNLCNATGAAFSALTSGTNTIAAMVLGTGASMSFAGATLPTPGAGVLGIAGEATKPTLAANGEGAVWLDSTTGGLGLIGKGSGSDVSMYNSAGTLGCAIATGTTTLSCVGLQGGTLTATGVTTVATVEGAERTVTAGSTDTLLSTDCGKTVLYNNAAYTVTIPAAIVPPAGTSCQIDIVTDTANKVTVTGTAVSAATLVSADSYTGTRNLAGAGISLKLINDGAAKAYLFGFGS